jgi:hypothetical protein
MDVVTGGLDVSDHGVDRGIRISHQSSLVPSDRLESADRATNIEKWSVEFRNVCAQRRRVPTRCLAHLRHGREYAPQALGSSCADVGLDQQKICDDADDRQGQNDNNPGNTRGGIAMLAQQNPSDQSSLDEDMKCNYRSGPH